jgi:hypothetical protein
MGEPMKRRARAVEMSRGDGKVAAEQCAGCEIALARNDADAGSVTEQAGVVRRESD